MHGDFSRLTFDPNKHYRSVRLQQGRPQLDANWNEQMDIINHALDTQFTDAFGSSAAPAAHAGFAITLDEADDQNAEALISDRGVRLADYWIGAGCLYVDGLRCENDRPLRFTAQPHRPELTSHKADYQLVYLEAWQREVGAYEDPALREAALGGLDTTLRTQLTWQVKSMPIHHEEPIDLNEVGYADVITWPEWLKQNEAASHTVQLSARRQPTAYGLDNRLYRVEIHDGQGADTTFKWSRENGSVVFEVQALQRVAASEDQRLLVTLSDLGGDHSHLQKDDWVELLDETSVLRGHSGALYQVMDVPDYARHQVALTGSSTPLTKSHTEAKRLWLRRWDQRGTETASTSGWRDSDSTGYVAGTRSGFTSSVLGGRYEGG